MALHEYRRKRDFAKTAEPRPTVKPSRGKPIFVVQKHDASRLHYDFRLEAEGVLKSWAVPKEPTLDPSVKRLAVQTEDHPLAYAKFHGDIPEGQYGAGNVEIWDRGTYDNLMESKPRPRSMKQSLEDGHVEVELHGKKLKGPFVLIRTREQRGKANWLLIKMKESKDSAGDSGARVQRKTGSRTRAAASSTKMKVSGDGKAEMPQFTHVDKVMFPEVGITKADVLRYYGEISPWLLPHLKDRPVTLERLPDGLREGGPRFWQKNTPDHYPDWIQRVTLKSEEGKNVRYALVNDVQTLLYLVNQGAMTFHVYFSRVQDLERPDFVLFDLDPPEGRFEDAVKIALHLHALLDEKDVANYVKTSGKRGLHVVTPWKDAGGYEEARSWAIAVAHRCARELPDIATTERSIAKRRGRVYVDVMQNALGRHAVPPYVLRATPGATVSMPLHWRQVKPGLDPAKFTLKAVLKAMRGKEDLFEGAISRSGR